MNEPEQPANEREADLIEPGILEPAPLLPGERPTAELLEDAHHWVAVYEELISFLRLHADLPDVLERYQRRLDHWRRIEAALEQSGGFRGQS